MLLITVAQQLLMAMDEKGPRAIPGRQAGLSALLADASPDHATCANCAKFMDNWTSDGVTYHGPSDDFAYPGFNDRVITTAEVWWEALHPDPASAPHLDINNEQRGAGGFCNRRPPVARYRRADEPLEAMNQYLPPATETRCFTQSQNQPVDLLMRGGRRCRFSVVARGYQKLIWMLETISRSSMVIRKQ